LKFINDEFISNKQKYFSLFFSFKLDIGNKVQVYLREKGFFFNAISKVDSIKEQKICFNTFLN